MLDSLDLANYRAAIIYSLVSVEPNRKSTIEKISQRLKESEHNAAVLINLLSLLMPESQSTVGEVLNYYSSDRPEIRMAVIDAIGRMDAEPKAAVDILQQALVDPAPQVRRLVIPALARIEPGEEVLKAAVVQQLGDEDEQVAEVAGKCLGFYAGKFDLILPDLQKILRGDDKRRIVATLTGFTSCGPVAAAATPDVVKLLENEDYTLQIRACWALIEIGIDRADEIVPSLNKFLDDEPDARVYPVVLQALSQFDLSDPASKSHLLNYLADENRFARYACVYGLRNSVSPENAEKILKTVTRDISPQTSQLSQFDDLIVKALEKGGEPVAEVVKNYLDDKDPFVKSRALRVVAKSELAKKDDVRQKIVNALSDERALVSYSAARAVTEFSVIDDSLWNKVFALADVNQRQRTADLLRLISNAGAKAKPIAGKVAELMNGNFRGRYANDAKKTIIKLGEHAVDALPVLAKGKPTIPKFECISAIGQENEAVAQMLRDYLDAVEIRIANGKNQNLNAVDRRGRLFAVRALAVASGDASRASQVIRVELGTELRPVALRMIEEAYRQDDSLIDDAIGFLPDKEAIATLAAIGKPAERSLELLRKLSSNKNDELASAAKRAVWIISDSPELAIERVEGILNENQLQPIELRLEDRQQMWDALRFLETKHGANPDVKKLLAKIERCRFSNLRNFVKDLRIESGGSR